MASISSVELRHIRYFLATARWQHVTRAADELHVTQSTLSHQLRQLEELLQVRLFDRVGRGVQLTEAGKIFFAYANRAVLEVEEGATAIRELGSVLRGHLRVGVIHTYNVTLLPTALAHFSIAHPGVDVIVEDLPAHAIEQDMADGRLDLGLAFAPSALSEVSVEPLFQEQLVLAIADNHPDAAQASIPAQSLAGYRLALQTQRFSSRRHIDSALGPWIAGAVHMEMSSVDALLKTVKLTNMAALLFESAVPKNAGLVCLRVMEPEVYRTAALLWHAQRTRSAAARRLAEIIRQTCAH